jgi:meso-butanediol dehydrogenase/(S,S)-butanediol dehydrogenase/diacetyl reductase
MRLRDKVVVITGTGDGQGRAAATRFAREGATVIGCDLDVDAAEETERLVKHAGFDMLSLAPLDLTRKEDVCRLASAVGERFGRVDGLYNNAAAARLGATLEIDEGDFDFTLHGVIGIPWRVTKHFAPLLAKALHPAVLNTASISGLLGSGMVGNAGLLGAYGAAKAAVIRLSQIMAVELAPFGIRVNTVSPGIIDTPAVAPILGSGDDARLRRWHEQQLLIRRVGLPEDVVNAALFLLSDEATYVTGHNLVVDGGWLASGGLGRENEAIREALDASLMSGLRY